MSSRPGKQSNPLAALPKVDRVLARPELEEWAGRGEATEVVRELLQRERERLRGGQGVAPEAAELARHAAARLRDRFRPRLVPVLNGTGIVIHTNLGRAPLGEEALEAVAVAARGYSTLEFDLEAGRRGSRHHLVTELLTALTGAEDALVANNNAAAVLLALGALAKRKRVVVSRGQLVEIGGSFRIPDICKASGAKLVEVGTTNRTRLSDFEQAVDERTGALLRVHPSNFRVVGFTEEVSLAELVELGRQRRIPVVDDLGSGALAEPGAGLEREPLAGESVAAGADVVTFSGDKLLGGPQAGIAVGRRKVIERMRRNPLMRAVRPGKLTLAALDATLRAYLRPEGPGELPVHRMLGIGVEALEEWGRPLLEAWEQPAEAAGLELAIVPSVARSGGGSLPGEELPSRALAFSGSGRALAALQRSLRLARPAVIGYLTEGRLHLDLRTLVLEDRARLEGVVADVLRERER